MNKMKFQTRSIKIRIPEEAWKKLDEYGYDYEKNITEELRKVYFEIRYYEDHPEETED